MMKVKIQTKMVPSTPSLPDWDLDVCAVSKSVSLGNKETRVFVLPVLLTVTLVK